MRATSPEKNRHEKRNDASEADPPRKFHRREPWRIDVGNLAEQSRDSVRQIAQDRNDDEANDHGDDVATIVAARFGEHAGEENSEDRAVGVTINPEHDRNDAHVR